MSGILADNVGRSSGLLKGTAAPSSDYVKITSGTMNTSGSVDYTISGTDYKDYRVVYEQVASSTNDTSVNFRVKQSSSFVTSGYLHGFNTSIRAASSSSHGMRSGYADGSFQIYYLDTQHSFTYKPIWEVYLFDVHNATKDKMFQSWFLTNDDNTYTNGWGGGIFTGTQAAALSGFQIYPSAGTLTGNYTIYGIK